jgi:signal transduction histidine kinase/FixJ family two-component response regulator
MIPRRFAVLRPVCRTLRCAAWAVLILHATAARARPGELGQPAVQVYSPRDYDGHNQVWASATDTDGLVYLGNQGAVLETDGVAWRRIPVGATVFVRALALAPDGRIYVGGVDELGYLEADRFGAKRFVSLRDRLEPGDREFGAVWKIVTSPGGVYFGAGPRVFRWHDGRFQVWRDPNPQVFQRLGGREGQVWVKSGGALERLAGGERTTVSADPRLGPMNLVEAWPDGDGVMLVTVADGLWRIDRAGGAAPYPTEIDAKLRGGGTLLSAARSADGGIVLGTTKDGLFQLDARGRFVRQVGPAEGLPHALVRIGAEDRAGGLWLGTNRGAARVMLGGARTSFGANQGLPMLVNAIVRHEDRLHAATGGGLFRLLPRDAANSANARFEPVPGLGAEPVFAVASTPAGLLVAENNRLIVHGGDAGRIETLLRSPTVLGLAASTTESSVWWGASGSGGGLARISLRGKEWKVERPFGGLGINFHTIGEDGRGDLWLTAAARGVWRIELGPAPAPGEARPVARVKHFAPGDGLPAKPGEIGMRIVDGEPSFRIDGALWVLDRQRDLLRLAAPELQRNRLETLREGHVRWIRDAEALDRIDSESEWPAAVARALIRGVRMDAGAAWPADDRLPADHKSLEFAFTAAPGAGPVQLQSQLRGFDETWSEPGATRSRTYTSLPAGAYVFAVRAREASGPWGPEATLAFSVPPAWWATWWARAGALLALLAGVGGFVRWRGRVLHRRNEQLQELVAARTADLRVARDAADSANRAKSAFLAHMSHELRTPLNGILGYAQLLRRETHLPEIHRARAGVIARSGEHLLSLINDVLDLAKIEAGHQRLNEADADLRGVVRGATELIRDRAEAKGLAFAVEFGEGLPGGVRTDEQKLRQVLLNLLGNAVQFTASGGVILRVRAVASDGASRPPFGSRGPFGFATVEFAVHDTGPGISPERQREIFRPFVSSATERSQGTGLGLALSQRHVALLGGELRLESEPGKGSRFFFQLTLPLAAAGVVVPARLIVGYEGTKRRVLVADDDAVSRTVLRELLAGVGFTVDEAATVDELRARLDATAPSLVLVELGLGGTVDALEPVRALRARPDGGARRIVAVSARAFPAEVAAAHEAGCDEFLAKPYVEAQLWDVIGRVLDLQWRHGEPDADARETGPARLPRAVIAELGEIVARGDVTGLRAALTRLRGRYPEQAGFIAGLEQLAATYDLERLGERLRAVDAGSPPRHG